MLGGVAIEHDMGLAGHSDADAVLHAVTDAVLGAAAAGDIGEHFPDTDSQWAGAASGKFLRHAVTLAGKLGLKVCNCDITVLAERPKLGPYKQAMRKSIASLLGIAADCVSVKAKTNECMGFVGRGEGIAAIAVVMLETSG